MESSLGSGSGRAENPLGPSSPMTRSTCHHALVESHLENLIRAELRWQHINALPETRSSGSQRTRECRLAFKGSSDPQVGLWRLLCQPGHRGLGGTLLLGDTWQRMETVLVVTTWGAGATGIWWVEARDATQHPTMHRTVSTTEHDPAPDVTNAKAEKACFQ